MPPLPYGDSEVAGGEADAEADPTFIKGEGECWGNCKL
jgi:hypothetical protein